MHHIIEVRFSTAAKQCASRAHVNTRVKNVEKVVGQFNSAAIEPTWWARKVFVHQEVVYMVVGFAEFKNATRTTHIVFPGLAKQIWTVWSEDDNLIALYNMFDAPPTSTQGLAGLATFKASCSEKWWKVANDGLSTTIDCVVVHTILETLVDAHDETGVSALVNCDSAVCWDNLASLISLGRSSANNFATLITKTLRVKGGNSPTPHCEIHCWSLVRRALGRVYLEGARARC